MHKPNPDVDVKLILTLTLKPSHTYQTGPAKVLPFPKMSSLCYIILIPLLPFPVFNPTFNSEDSL